MTHTLDHLRAITGDAVYARLCQELAGERLCLPSRRTTVAAHRRIEVARLLREGLDCDAIAERLCISVRRVRAICALPDATVGGMAS